MGNWAPLVLGYGYILIVIAAIALFPNSWWARDLKRSIGVKGTGPEGSLHRRDHFRAAAVSVALAVVLVGGCFIGFALAERFPNESRANHLAGAYAFMCFILGAMAAVTAVAASWAGIRWKPPKRAEVDEPVNSRGHS